MTDILHSPRRSSRMANFTQIMLTYSELAEILPKHAGYCVSVSLFISEE